MTSRPLATAIVLLLLAPALAAAEPATIRVFEAEAHASADAASPVLHVFTEGAQVSVSETGEGGWRRIRLPDGSAGWVPESALAFPSPLASPPAEPPALPAALAPPPPAPDLRPRIYVKDLDHFASLVQEDPELAGRATSLVSRRKQAIAVGVIGTLGGIALTVGGIAKSASDTIGDPASPDFGKRDSSAGPAMVAVGLGVAVVAAIYAGVRAPKGAELIDIVNGWNARHPDRPFTLDRGGVDLGAASSGR